MAKLSFDDSEGKWRTIGGRRVFIREGQSLSDAMKASGKFKSAKKKNEVKDESKSFSREELKEKYGTDDVDLINAGKAKEDRVTLKEDKKEQKSIEDNKSPGQKTADLIKESGVKTFADEIKENDVANRVKENKIVDSYGKNVVYQTKEGNYITSRQNYNDYVNGKTNKLGGELVLNEKEARERLASYDADEKYPYKGYVDDVKTGNGQKAEELKKETLNKMYKSIGYDDSKYNYGLEKESSTKESNYRNKITDVAKNSKEDNVTLDVETGKPVSFEKGYSVSFQQSSDNYSDEEYHAKVEECKAKCDGKVYAGKYGGDAEASFHTDSLEDAKELMYKYNQESIYDWQHETLIMNDKYNASTNKTNYKEEKATNDYMNDKIRSGASKNKFKEDLPKRTEIKTQGTSNRKEVSENIQAHILDYYDSPDDFIQQMDVMREPTMWRAGEKIAQGGSYLIYNGDMADFLNELKINPKGKTFSDEKAFNTYTSLVGRESAKLYDRLKKNAYRKYMKEHPNSEMSFGEFKDMTKGGK